MTHTYKCPGCGAPLEYKPGEEDIVCAYCGVHTKLSDLSDDNDKYEYDVTNEAQETEQRNDFNSYTCQSCGATLIMDENTTATKCSYCGSPAIISNRLSGVLRPAQVIPFKIDREQAKGRFRDWLCKGVFTPSVFKNAATLEEIKGIYVPFWLYDYDAKSYMEAACTRVKRERKGNMEYTHTDHYHVVRDVNGSFLKIPVDASEKMPDEIMDLLEPYDYKELKEFDMPYLSGYESEKYSYESGEKAVAGRVENRVSKYIYEAARDSIKGYSSVHVNTNRVNMSRKKAVYTLLPVWMATYRYKDENKIFAINGQTGKQVGTLPKSTEKMLAWFGGITASITVLLTVVGMLFG